MKSRLLILTLVPSLFAQDEPGAVAARLGATPFLAPIRGHAPDLGVGGGLWASGANYKVSFHDDGVNFYPVLGASAPKNLPLRWRTRAITLGGQATASPLAQAQAHAADWRYEIRRGGVTEAYDVRNDGIEQTFVLHGRPASDGDLLITGDVESELTGAPTTWQHGALEFRDSDGNPRVRYGAATAIDAVGRRVAMESCFDGKAVSLRLSGQWLANASYPVVVDPLLSANNLAMDVATLSGLDVAHDDGSNALMVTFRRATSAADYDGFGLLVRDDFAAIGTTVFADVDNTWSTEHLSVALVGGTNKWIIAMQRYFPYWGQESFLRYRLHDTSDPIPDNTVTSVLKPAGQNWMAPDVGGTLTNGAGQDALIVFRAEYPSLPYNSDVFGILVDTATNTPGNAFALANPASGTSYDRSNPRVNKENGGPNSSWIVAFSEINRTQVNDDYDVFVVRVGPDGSVTARSSVPSGVSDHKLAASVDGRDGRYMVAYGVRATGHGVVWSHTVRARRLNFADAAASPTFGADSVLASGGEFYPTDIAYDTRTRSHWVATWYSSAWNGYAARLGYDNVIAESVTFHDTSDPTTTPAVCFNDDDRHYHIVYPVGSGLSQVRNRTLVYPDTNWVRQGSGCGNGDISANDRPLAGSEFFAVRGTGMPNFTAAVLLAATATANLPLDLQGMPGCALQLGPASVLFTVNAAANASGTVEVALPLPTLLAGTDVYFQWAYVAFGANPVNVLATRRLLTPVR